jgi:hypothetical protein
MQLPPQTTRSSRQTRPKRARSLAPGEGQAQAVVFQQTTCQGSSDQLVKPTKPSALFEFVSTHVTGLTVLASPGRAVTYADGFSRAVSRFQQNLVQSLDPREPVRASVHTQAGYAARSFSSVVIGSTLALKDDRLECLH